MHGGQYVFLFVGSFVGCLVSSKEMCFPPKEYQDYNKKKMLMFYLRRVSFPQA